MAIKNIVMCGDSFAAGIGCHDLTTEPVVALVAKDLNKPWLNLAKGSSTNLSIFLQAKYVVEELKDTTDLVLIGNTSYDRVEWFPEGTELSDKELTMLDVNYHDYPPFMPCSYVVNGQGIEARPHPMEHRDDYSGKMLTENYMGVIDFWETFASRDQVSDYYKRFATEPKNKMKALYNFAAMVHEPRINRIYSIGVLTMAHNILKKNKINHLIFSQEPDSYANYIDRENLVEISWGQLSLDYPDDLGTYHTSAEGHQVAARAVMTKLKENKWAKKWKSKK